jgi:hypothetical protein
MLQQLPTAEQSDVIRDTLDIEKRSEVSAEVLELRAFR